MRPRLQSERDLYTQGRTSQAFERSRRRDVPTNGRSASTVPPAHKTRAQSETPPQSPSCVELSLPGTTSWTSFCYKEEVGRLSWLGALLGALALHAGAPQVLAQDEPEIEVITEPPPQLEPPPAEPPPERPPPQPEKPEEPLGHLRVGGGIGFGFGSNFISIGISPQVSYIFKRIVEPGVAFRYQYAKDSFPSSRHHLAHLRWLALRSNLSD